MKVSNINQFSLLNKNIVSRDKNVSFGRLVNGTDYPDEMVEEAENIIKENLRVDKDRYKKSFMECWEDASFQPVTWLFSPYAKLEGSSDPIRDTRIAMGIATLGISELLKTPEAAIRKLVADIKTDKYVSKLKDCVIDLMKEKKLR